MRFEDKDDVARICLDRLPTLRGTSGSFEEASYQDNTPPHCQGHGNAQTRKAPPVRAFPNLMPSRM